MIENNRNNEQIYGRNDMIMLDPNNKIYGSLGLADNYVMKTEEGTRLVLNNPKSGRFCDVLTEFNIYGRSEQKSTTGAQLANLPNKTNVVINGVTWTSKDNVVTAIGETGEKVSSTRPEIFYNIPIEPGDYYVSGSTNVVKVIVQFISNSGEYSHHIGDGTFTLTGDERRVTVYLDAAQNSKINNTVKVMLNKGDISLPFEPYTGGIPSPSPEYPQEIKSVGDRQNIKVTLGKDVEYSLRLQIPKGEMLNTTVQVSLTKSKITSYEPYYEEQTATLPYILNAIPVSSGGNYTDADGKQWIADYIDFKRGKLVRMCERKTLNTKNGEINEEYRLALMVEHAAKQQGDKECIFSAFEWASWTTCAVGTSVYIKNIKKPNNELYTAQELKELSLDFDVIYQLAEQQEADLTQEEIEQYKKLSTRTPTTIIENNYNTWMKATYKSIESV